MTSTVVITKLDGTTYDLNELGFHVKKFDVPYPNFQYTFQSMSTYHNLSLAVISKTNEIVVC